MPAALFRRWPVANRNVDESEGAGLLRGLSPEAIFRIKRTAFRDKDRTLLRDPIDVGLMDADCLVR